MRSEDTSPRDGDERLMPLVGHPGVAEPVARSEDIITCAGLLAKAAIAAAQAVLAERGEWALNEKGIVERADLGAASAILERLTPAKLHEPAKEMRELLLPAAGVY